MAIVLNLPAILWSCEASPYLVLKLPISLLARPPIGRRLRGSWQQLHSNPLQCHSIYLPDQEGTKASR